MSEIQPTMTCGLVNNRSKFVRLGHGSGGRMSTDLIEELFLNRLPNHPSVGIEDATILPFGGAQLAVTTDSYVVSPIFFPGGNIGSLSVHGTINDLSVRGAKPLFLSAAFILEEGLDLDALKVIVQSMGDACRESGVTFVAGDTKVVNKGAGDKVFITTTGIGEVIFPAPGATRVTPGDVLIVSGSLGLHGMAIMCSREGLELDSTIQSDSAPLWDLVQAMFGACKDIHFLRDITRGGLASVLNEVCVASDVGIELQERDIPVDPQAKAACELLGLDPLYVACEGRLAAMIPAADASSVLAAMQLIPAGRGAAIVGLAVGEHKKRVALVSSVGGRRIVDKLSGEQLPRIC